MMNKNELILHIQELAKRFQLTKNDTINLASFYLVKNNYNPLFRLYKISIKWIGCNAKCPVCDDWKNKWNLIKIRKALYTAFQSVLWENVKKKQIYILWWEPLLIIDDLIKMIMIGRKYNIVFSFATNGSLLNKVIADRLINAGLSNITFSLDFPTDQHDHWRGLEGSYKNILKFTEYMKHHGVVVNWNTVVWKFNHTVLSDFEELYRQVHPDIHDYISIEDNGGVSLLHFLDRSEFKKIMGTLSKIRDRNSAFTINLQGFREEKERLEITPCYIPLKNRHYYINNNGDTNIIPCYIEWTTKIASLNEFTISAMENWCNKCSGSCKDVYNSYMENLIQNTTT